MSESRIFEGKTSSEAIEKGLKELKVSRNEVDIKILEDHDKRSFFSILAPRVVKVEITVKERKKEPEKNTVIEKKEEKLEKEVVDIAINNLNSFLENWVKLLPSEDLKYEIMDENPFIKVIFNGDNLNYLIGYRGETLNALQTLLSSIAGRNIDKKIRVIVDISNYKEKREKVLKQLAEKIAKTVVKTRRSVTLEPMTAYERRIIHCELQNNPRVKTSSIGEEPYRKVVISLKKQ